MAIRTDWTALWIGIGVALMSGCVLIIWPTQAFAWIGLLIGAVITGAATAHKVGGIYVKVAGGAFGAFLIVMLWILVPHATTPDAMRGKEHLPGFSTVVEFEPKDLNERQRKTYFSFESSEGAEISMYLAANGVFTFSLVDVAGEHYTLEIPLGYDGIPINEFVIAVLEVGVATNYGFMRVVVNGHEVAHRDLFRPDLGDRKWRMKRLGSGPMAWTGQVVRYTTLTNDEINAFVSDERAFREAAKARAAQMPPINPPAAPPPSPAPPK